MAPRIAIITASFPYLPGEQFLEDEIQFWGDAPFSRVFLLPTSAKGSPRCVPHGITIDLCLSQVPGTTKLKHLVLASFSPIFFREVAYLYSTSNLTPRHLLIALDTTRKVLYRAKTLLRFVERFGPLDLIYCYWNNTTAYACCLAKRSGGVVAQVVSRAHGVDVYEERNRRNYMPLKRQFIRDFDKIFTLSAEGHAYFRERYCAKPTQLSIARLGVPLPEMPARISPLGNLHILSVSFCVPVKRIDKIIAAVALLAKKRPDLSVRWSHIGGGPLLSTLSDTARVSLGSLENVAYCFFGGRSNRFVREFYNANPVDVFVNASESEGVPVSIMEAMSYAVPAIAPDVGGVASLMDQKSGLLLGPDPLPEEISTSILRVAELGDLSVRRNAARETIESQFNSTNNYPHFVGELHSIAKSVPLEQSESS